MYNDFDDIDPTDEDKEWEIPLDVSQKINGHDNKQFGINKQKSSSLIHETPTSVGMSKLKHSRTIIHIDIDCFYAQVEMIRNPHLRDKPLGIQQKYIVVTCNYKAREFGVTKLMTIKDAKEKCPQLVLVNGEDLTHYREMSYKISECLQKYTPNVERLGFDENFLDVTEIVNQRINSKEYDNEVKGHVFEPKDESASVTRPCDCGCRLQLTVGSQIAQDIRTMLYEELGVTSCAGISYNKLLAKKIGEKHKPNQQTTLFSGETQLFMSSLAKASKIPGIGSAMSKKLAKLDIISVVDLQNKDISDLIQELGESQAHTIKQLSLGIDDSPVIPYGRPQTLSDEDSFRNCCTVPQVKLKASSLLRNLVQRLKDDGRLVQTIRLSIRRLTAENKWTNRESRQCPIPSHINTKLKQGKDEIVLQELEKITMNLFTKMIDTTHPFHLTLMNIAFCNLTEKPKNSIQNFLSPKKSSATKSSTDPSQNEDFSNSVSNIKTEKSPQMKKGILSFFKTSEDSCKNSSLQLEKKRKCVSPSKENVKKTKHDNFQEIAQTMESESVTKNSCKGQSELNSLSVNGIQMEVFNQLPSDIQQEILQTQVQQQAVTNNLEPSPSQNHESDSLPLSDNSLSCHDEKSHCGPSSDDNQLRTKLLSAGIDFRDFISFPQDVQDDILKQYNIQRKQISPPKDKKISIMSYFTTKNNKK